MPCSSVLMDFIIQIILFSLMFIVSIIGTLFFGSVVVVSFLMILGTLGVI